MTAISKCHVTLWVGCPHPKYVKQCGQATYGNIVPLVTISNHWQNYLIFTLVVIFWSVWNPNCFCIVWYKRYIKSNCLIILFKLFSVFWSSWKFYPFPIILTNIKINFWYSLRFVSIFWWFSTSFKTFWKQLLSLIIATFLLLNHSEENNSVFYSNIIIISLSIIINH